MSSSTGAQALMNWLEETGLENIVWATDLDLTISDMQVDDFAAANNPELSTLCQKLERLTEGRFYIITGRDMSSLDDILGPTRFKASTEYHCRMRLDPAAPPVDLIDVPQWELIEAAIKEVTDDHPGMGVRDKPFMRTVFYEHMPELMNNPAARVEIRERLDAILAHLTDMTDQELSNTDGGGVFDLGPAAGDKKEAYACIYAHASQGHKGKGPLVPIYFGDSPGDLPAAAFAKENGGIFVSIGNDPEIMAQADFHLSSPDECRALIKAVTQNVTLKPSAPAHQARPRPQGPKGP